MNLLLTILTSWKIAASSVLTVNYRGEALFVNVFAPNKESCLRQNGKFVFVYCLLGNTYSVPPRITQTLHLNFHKPFNANLRRQEALKAYTGLPF